MGLGDGWPAARRSALHRRREPAWCGRRRRRAACCGGRGAPGAGQVRLDVRWNEVEPERGRFDFSQTDPMIDAAVAAGLVPIGILAYGVPWATASTEDDGGDIFFPPDDPADFAAYVRETVRH